jgi:predicted RNA-binding protein with PUA-like domain
MATFLFKTEPGDYSYPDLIADKRTVWTGVSNNAALAHLRAIRKGDEVLIYHTGDEKAIVGLATAASDPYPDPKSPGLNAAGLPRMPVVDLKPVRALKRPVTLAELKSDPHLATFALVRQPRLSVMPVPPDFDLAIRALAGL